MRDILIGTVLIGWTASAVHLGSFHLGSFHLGSFPLFTLLGSINETLQQVLTSVG